MGEAPALLRLWLIDDTRDHHATVRATLRGVRRVEFTGFTVAAEAIDGFAALARAAPAELPSIVLMDYFLGTTHGSEVTKRLRELQPAGAGLTIVGYSSVAAGSRAIVEAGGDLIVRKVRTESGVNPLLLRFLTDRLEAIKRAR
jgi:CheY-like chemotaxis protein